MVGGDLSAHISLKSYFLKLRCLRCIKMLEEAQMASKTLHFRSSHATHTQDGLWVDAPTPTAHGMYGTHATHTAWAVGHCTNTHSTWYVWYTCHTHSMGCGSMHQHPQHMACMVHMPHTHIMGCGSMHQHPQHMVCMAHMPHTQHGLWVDAPTPTAHGMHGTHNIG